MDIPLEALDEQTLFYIVEEFVTRDGTEFTDVKEKVNAVISQLKKGKARITFDHESKSCNIIQN